MKDFKTLLTKPEFPLSSRYDAEWMIANQMGPNVLWLTEWLAAELSLKPGMRVLDLGCGRAGSSIFLAREFGVQVWAADLWISPQNNRKRAEAAGEAARVFPMRAEAHALPFPDEFFDAIVSIDAYQYFGTDVLYLGYLSRFIRKDGYIGIVVPGIMQEFKVVPDHLALPQANGKIFWEEECWSFKTADWWREHWSRTSKVTDIRVDTLKDGWRHWYDFERVVEAVGSSVFPSDAEALAKDEGRYIGFVRAIARRCGEVGENLYSPSLGVEVGVDD